MAAELEAALGLSGADLHYGLTQRELFEAAVTGDLGRIRPGGPDDEHKAYATVLGADGPLIYYTDPSCTGRPVHDTFCVDRLSVRDEVWWKDGFAPFEEALFDPLVERVVEHLNQRRARLYVSDLYCGTDPDFAEPCRFVGEYATHAYFCNIMLPARITGAPDRLGRSWTLLNVPSFRCSPQRDGTRSQRGVIIDMQRRLVLVLGRADYCGVNKKTMFTVMNFVQPGNGQLPMHCSANVSADGDCAILFGLSGTGKTTLSADPDRDLIGDDEHIWTDTGIANLEAGCYAKLIDLDKQAEPVIAAAMSMRGTLIENVPALDGRRLADTHPDEFDLGDRAITENTRFAYPLECNPNVAEGRRGPHPSTIVLLTADAFGVLPPVAVLEPGEVMYHFVMGFTAKLAGTEVGVTEPAATFSPCFGAPFMARKPDVYARLLKQRMHDHETRCVLLNTGWSGGAYGAGRRMSLAVTRRLLDAALSGEFDDVETRTHPILGLRMPVSCRGVDSDILDPGDTWEVPGAYDAAARRLREMFRDRYEQQSYSEMGIAAAM
ncbi:MAG: phosphoenolpyruvate carboxykinase (ATP) [Acidimicrobiaceae bacterium]|nr:phosphoenolpyruvate carboxykinase (ATP) [Acidimicrobiaceae bacterium]